MKTEALFDYDKEWGLAGKAGIIRETSQYLLVKWHNPVTGEDEDTYLFKNAAYRVLTAYAFYSRMRQARAVCKRYAKEEDRDGVGTQVFAQSLAEHSFMVACLCSIVTQAYRSELAADGIEVDVDRLTLTAIFHDIPESLTGDAATNVDGVTKEQKDESESAAISRMFSWANGSHNHVRDALSVYEEKLSPSAKTLKMIDSLELILYTWEELAQYGAGIIKRSEIDKYDQRVRGEVDPYFENPKVEQVSVAQIMYDHSLAILKRRLPGTVLVHIFDEICQMAMKFPWQAYSLNEMNTRFK